MTSRWPRPGKLKIYTEISRRLTPFDPPRFDPVDFVLVRRKAEIRVGIW